MFQQTPILKSLLPDIPICDRTFCWHSHPTSDPAASTPEETRGETEENRSSIGEMDGDGKRIQKMMMNSGASGMMATITGLPQKSSTGWLK